MDNYCIMKLSPPPCIGCLRGSLLWCWLIFVGVTLVASELSATGLVPMDESYSARAWRSEDGLPENRVIGVAQSPDGFLWVATQGGVLRFDGVRFQRVSMVGAPNLIAGTMRAILPDRSGRIWLAKEEDDTLFCFDGAQMRMVTSEQGLPKNERQYSMAVDGEDSLWVTYGSGKVVRYRDGKVEIFTSKDGLPEGGGNCWLASGRDGVLWFSKGRQVGIFREGRFHVLETFGSSTLRIAPARAGGIWISTRHRVLKYDQGAETVELGRIISPETRDQTSLEPSVLLEDRNGVVWVGTASAGLYRFESNSVARVEVSNPAILSLTEDREGSLWVGTRGGGLNRVHRRVLSLIDSADGLPFEGVQSVCQDATGALWAVGDNGVLACRREAKWAVQSPTSSSNEVYVTCVTANTNGSVWIGTRGGALYRWADGRFTDARLRESLQGKSVRSLLATRAGDLWISTDATEAIYRLRGEKLQTFNLPPGYRYIRAMAEDAAENFWAGASDGLLIRVTGDTLVNEATNSGFLSIRCLYGAANGDVWLGYAGGGVGRIRNGQTTRFTTENGLPNDYVSQILEEGWDALWFAGNQGVFKVRSREFDDMATGSASRIWPVVYGRSEGVRGLQASFDYCPSSFRAGTDRLYFSMLSGLAEVRLDYAQLNYRPPNVFIERVLGGERTFAAYQNFGGAATTNGPVPLDLGDPAGQRELRLPPGLQLVQFEFTALSFVAPDNVHFRYQLEGLDENWVDAGTRRVASYTHPPPGTYRLKVIACNNDGIWNKTGDTLKVIIAPFIWETAWFKLTLTTVIFLALCGVVVLVLRRRHRLEVERLEHQRALEAERTRIARDLHDDLGVGLTEIGLLGDLANAGSGMPEASQQRVTEMTGRARALAASLDEIVWAINPANDTSQSLVDYFFPYAQKLLGKAGIRCRLEVVEPLPAGNLSAEDRHEFFHAYKEALNNIIRHSGATQVQVTLAEVQGSLQIQVSDNGRGLGDAAGRGAHHGLSGMRERLLRLGGRCEINRSPGGGTTVTFTIPVQPNNL
jgi:signal transduction histidine kinase/ligand-binding sensor domain-containing protein